MTKEELQKELDSKGVPYDKRWGVAKLKMALEDNKEEVVPKEDTPEIEPPAEEPETPATEEGMAQGQDTQEEPNAAVQEIRKNAMIAREMVQARPSRTPVRILKNKGAVYVKREVADGVEIYEKTKGKYIRTYTKKDHGEDYKKLADRFIETRKNVMEAV